MIDLVGKKFGRLLVVKQAGKDSGGNFLWSCLCDCGAIKNILGRNLKNGASQSCGCLQRQRVVEKLTKHGRSPKKGAHKIYRIWTSMIQRCTNPNDGGYTTYGARGIKVCDRWSMFENFLADMGEVPEGCQLDRIDNDGDYCLSNCRWVTRKQQARNRSTTHLITHDGRTQCLSDWAKELNITSTALSFRLRNPSWSREKALTLRKK